MKLKVHFPEASSLSIIRRISPMLNSGTVLIPVSNDDHHHGGISEPDQLAGWILQCWNRFGQ